jgi:hypothetical protein
MLIYKKLNLTKEVVEEVIMTLRLQITQEAQRGRLKKMLTLVVDKQ